MQTTIDGAGRLVVPKQIRDRLHLSAGSAVEVSERDGVVEVRPVAAQIEIVETPEGPVATIPEAGPTLTGEEVREALEGLRGR